MAKTTKGIIGYYHPHGYNIWLMSANGNLVDQLYEAGNSPCDSQMRVPVAEGEDLETLKKYCEQTGKEMAKEQGLPWLGSEEESDPWEEEDL